LANPKDVSDIRDILAKESGYFLAERLFQKSDNKPSASEETSKPSTGNLPSQVKVYKL
jgi:hypothetical protein